MNEYKQIGILGTGTWGMALGRMLFNSGHSVTMWSVSEDEIQTYSSTHQHPNLPGMIIPNGIQFTTDISAVREKEIIVFAVPSPFVRETARKIAPYISNGQIVVDVAKGIESHSLLTMTQVIDEVFRENGIVAKLVALSGPTHAEEVSKDLPTTIVAACEDKATAEIVQDIFMNDCMRVYTNSDVLGVELCGALKNIVALAVGISKGAGYGDNTKAALMTRGIAEITRLGVAMGCVEQTFSGLAGIGDLIVTATSEHSRNNRAGQLIGSGINPQEAISSIGMVVEGINALPAALELSKRYDVDMPIIWGVNAIINEQMSPKDMVIDLMNRPKTTELPRSILDMNFENKVLQNRRNASMKRVITYGTFDLLHYGHINLLKRAKALGDYLVVVVSTDEFNWNEKQKKCYFSYEQRKALVESIRYVDLVIPETCWEQKRTDIHEYHIDTFVMGDDWEGKFDFLKEEGAAVVYLPRTPEISTTQIKKDLHDIKKQ